MQITDEMKERAAKASSASELKKIAEEYEITLSDEEAEKFMAFTRNGELSDDELEIVAGGKGKKVPDPKFKEGQHLWIGYFTTQNYCEIEILYPEFYSQNDSWRYATYDIDHNIYCSDYVEKHKYIHYSNPGPGWHD